VWSRRGLPHAWRGISVSGCWSQRRFHGCREIGLWREIICNFNPLRVTLQAICAPPRHTTPMGFPSFPTAKQSNRTQEIFATSRQASKHNTATSAENQAEQKKPPSTCPLPLICTSRVIFKIRTHRSLVQVSLSRYHRSGLSSSRRFLRTGGVWSGLSQSLGGIGTVVGSSVVWL